MAKLILYNDNKSSFNKVKASLIRFCEHEHLQADQCALIAHNNGKVTIKEGDFMDLYNIKNNLDKYDLKVELIK